MSRCHQGIARVLVVTCFGGALLGSAVVASAADGAKHCTRRTANPATAPMAMRPQPWPRV